MRIRTLTTEQWLPQSIETVFNFFGDASNLERLTPPWLRFRILTPAPIAMGKGTLLDYRIRWRWLPLRWRTEITVWEPPHRFIDQQIRGPYRLWNHEHSFEERDGGTLCRDRVHYAIPGWLLEPLLHFMVVGPDAARIFAFRRARMQKLLGPSSRDEVER